MTRGFVCECGERHEFSGYVYAHWRTDLVFTCPKCIAEYKVLEGTATKGGKCAENWNDQEAPDAQDD